MIPACIVDAFIVICLCPLFVIRALHWLADRFVLNDRDASVLVDSFATRYAYVSFCVTNFRSVGRI